MSSSLLLEQGFAYLVRQTLIAFMMAVQLLFFRVLPPGLVPYCSQHSCVIAIKLFLHALS